MNYLKLQAGVTAPGTFGADETLDPINKHHGMEIYLIDKANLEVTYKGARHWIPGANAKIAKFEDLEDEPTIKIPKSQKN